MCLYYLTIYLVYINPELGIELLNNYIELTYQDNNSIVNMSPNSGKGPDNYPLGSNNNPLGGGGPSNPNNKPDPLLNPEPLDKNKRPRRLLPNPETVWPNNNPDPLANSKPLEPNYNPDPLPEYESLGKQSDRKRPYYRLDFCKGKGKCIRWYYYCEIEKREICPEGAHLVQPVYNPELTVRSYAENGLTYTYDCRSKNPLDHYCKIQYPDNSSVNIYDKPRVVEHIRLHQDNKWENNIFKDDKYFDETYKKFFDKNNKKKIEIWLGGRR